MENEFNNEDYQDDFYNREGVVERQEFLRPVYKDGVLIGWEMGA